MYFICLKHVEAQTLKLGILGLMYQRRHMICYTYLRANRDALDPSTSILKPVEHSAVISRAVFYLDYGSIGTQGKDTKCTSASG